MNQQLALYDTDSHGKEESWAKADCHLSDSFKIILTVETRYA